MTDSKDEGGTLQGVNSYLHYPRVKESVVPMPQSGVVFNLNQFATFYAPGLKGPPGASSVWIVCLFVCLSVRYSAVQFYKQSAIFKVLVVIQ